MVASQDSASPLVVVVGITGKQGGSVANHLLASDKPYRIVGLTRTPSKPTAQAFADKGVVLREVNLQVGNEDKVVEAFKGADYVFAMTNFAELLSIEKEIAQGKLLVDAAKAVGVKLFIWSCNDSASLISGKKYTVSPTESKSAVTQYLKESSVPYALVKPGVFLSNFIGTSLFAPAKESEGNYVLYMPSPEGTTVPIIDINKDYGAYVRAAIENPNMGAGSELLTGIPTTYGEMMKNLSEFTGASFTFKQLSKDEWVAKHGAYAAGFYDLFNYCHEFGFYGPKDIAASQKRAGVTSPTFAEQLKTYEPKVFLDKST